MYIEVIRKVSDLEYNSFGFWFDSSTCAIILDSYVNYTRKTTRHKYLSSMCYNRLLKRGNKLIAEEIPLTDDVKQEAINFITNKLHVTLQYE